MTALSKKWFVVINPTSGNGNSKRKWPEIENLLKTYGFDFQYAFTEYSKHSISLVHQAIENGFTNFICVGGDGTLHNIVNGIMTQTMVPSAYINVGMIPIGTGNDWIKTHNIPLDLKSAIQIIKNEKIVQQDLGKIEFINQNISSVYFNNLAGIGFDGYVVSKVEKYKHVGKFAYLLGAIIGLFSFKNFDSRTLMPSKEFSGKTLMILIGLCQYSGGGMQLTKTPNPFDGLFDVSIAKDLSRLDIIINMGSLFNGKIVNHKKVQSIKTDLLTVEIKQNKRPYIQADGELIGTGDIRISLIPKAFSFYC